MNSQILVFILEMNVYYDNKIPEDLKVCLLTVRGSFFAFRPLAKFLEKECFAPHSSSSLRSSGIAISVHSIVVVVVVVARC